MLERVLGQLRQVEELAEHIVGWHTFPAQEAVTCPLPDDLPAEIAATLARRGIESLYRHQRMAIDHVRAGRNVVVVTPTASGKSLCYNLPVLERLVAPALSGVEGGGRPRALYLFPTKALSQDQVGELGELLTGLGERGRGLQAYTYDGDTPPATRQRLREAGDVVVTNPYMLHQGLLPNHTKWVSLFRELAGGRRR